MSENKDQGESGAPEPGRERRRFERVTVSRRVVFSDYGGGGPLHNGIASNMSAGGMRIESRFPQKVGSEIHIELQPDEKNSSAGVTFFHGRVVRTVERKNGEYAMGIQIIPKIGGRL